MPMSDLFFHSLCELCISDISEVLLLMFSFDISCCVLMLIVKYPAEPARPPPLHPHLVSADGRPSLTYSC